MTDQGHDKKHQENEEQDLGDSRGRRSNHAKSQHPGDHRDYEEHQRVIKHLLLLQAGSAHCVRVPLRRSVRQAVRPTGVVFVLIVLLVFATR